MGTVLVLCDDLAFATQIADAVRRGGGEPAVTATAEAALAVSREQPPDGVVVALAARTFDGPSAVRALRGALPAVPIIGFCGHLDVARQRAGRTAGATRVVSNAVVAREAQRLATALRA